MQILLLVVCVLLIGLAVIVLLLRQRADRLAADIQAVLKRQLETHEQLSLLEGEVASNRENGKTILSLLGDLGKAAKTAHKAEVEAVAAEVRMLQSIVEQLTRVRPIGGGASVTLTKTGKTHEVPAEHTPVIRTDYDREKILQVIEGALRADRIDLYIQPIVSLPQRKIRHFECFSRIRDEENAIILPEQYVRVAEEEGLMAGIDNMLLFRCIQLVRRANINNFHGSFFCNLSKHTLHDLHFLADFLEFLKENKELATKLVFEISQADFDERDAMREKLLLRLHEAGCRLALSSVTNPRIIEVDALDRCRFKFVKIEGSVLQSSLSLDPPLDLQIYRRVLANHNIDLIVERIETEQNLLEFLEHNIDYGQGYLFGEPKLSKGQ